MTKAPQWLAQVPNALTIVRLILVPVLLWLMVLYPSQTMSGMWWALLVFVIAAVTDKLDGDIARSYGLVSDFGKLMDPIADKALVLPAMALATWSMWGQLWSPVVVLCLFCVFLIVVREFGISAWRMVLVRRGQVVPASRGGKVKTFAQMTFIMWRLVPWNTFLSTGVSVFIGYLTVLVLIAATYLALISAWDYVR